VFVGSVENFVVAVVAAALADSVDGVVESNVTVDSWVISGADADNCVGDKLILCPFCI
jgi:hypothetical protein